MVRFTFSTRIDNLALDILERPVRARYAPVARRCTLLAAADASLAVLRVLVRLCYDRRFLDRRGLEQPPSYPAPGQALQARAFPPQPQPAAFQVVLLPRVLCGSPRLPLGQENNPEWPLSSDGTAWHPG